jgi:hypothetical protein
MFRDIASFTKDLALNSNLPGHVALSGMFARPRLYGAMFLVLSAAATIPILFESSTEWDEVYGQAARRLSTGQAFIAEVSIAIEAAGPRVGRWIWLTINVLAAGIAIRSGWQAAGNRGYPRSAVEDAIFCLGLLCGLRYLLNGFSHLQTDVLIACLMLLGCERISRGQSRWAGCCWGLAAAIKGPALLWIGYLLFRRQWVASIVMAGTLAAASLLPDLLHPTGDGSLWIGRWLQTQATVVSRDQQYPGVWASTIENNQSLAGLVGRLTVAEWRQAHGQYITSVPAEPWWSVQATKWILYSIEAVLAIVTFAAMVRTTSKTNSAERTAIECGLVLTLIVLVSPMSSKPHFITMMLPGWLLARSALSNARPFSVVMLIAAVTGLNIGWNFFGDQIEFLALWTGAMTIGTLALWSGLIEMRWSDRPTNQKVVEDLSLPMHRAA